METMFKEKITIEIYDEEIFDFIKSEAYNAGLLPTEYVQTILVSNLRDKRKFDEDELNDDDKDDTENQYYLEERKAMLEKNKKRQEQSEIEDALKNEFLKSVIKSIDKINDRLDSGTQLNHHFVDVIKQGVAYIKKCNAEDSDTPNKENEA